MKPTFNIKLQRTKPKAYTTTMTVGVQTMTFGREYETKKEARWYIKMFKIMLKNLDPKIEEPKD